MFRLYFFMMKRLIFFVATIFLISNVNAFAAEKKGILDKIEGGLDRIFGKEVETKSDVKLKRKNKTSKNKTPKNKNSQYEVVDRSCKNKKKGSLDKLEAGLDKIFGKQVHTKADARTDKNCYSENAQAKVEDKDSTKLKASSNNNLSFYTGTFDLIDKEGDDQTALFGIEHKNQDLFRNTFLGKFKPITGAFMTGKSSLYLYTGIEGQYGLGPLKILPSFAPGYYEKGDGKDLGSVMEFKSEIKLGVDIFENSNLSYSYSHISNNDWGKVNPGTDNQQLTFSKNF